MFTLKIKLGNAAMQAKDDVSRALNSLAIKFDGRGSDDDEGIIMDANGNRVGEWKFRADKRLARRETEE